MEKKEIFVIGGGPSLVEFDFSKLKDRTTIAVNKAIFDVPSPDYFITVDYIFLKRQGVHNRKQFFDSIITTKVFVVNLSIPYIQETAGRIVDVRNHRVYELNEFDLIIKSRKTEGIGYTFKDFRTGLSSGYCALQLAIVLGYTKIYLLGIDLNQDKKTHYHEGYGERPSKFNRRIPIYLHHFREGIEQIKKDGKEIEIISLSSVSQLNKNLPYQDVGEVL